MNAMNTLPARQMSAWRELLLLLALSAAVAACDGATEPVVPAPALPAPPVPAPPPPAPPVPAPFQPAGIIKVSGDDQHGRPGSQLKPIVVAVVDSSGHPVPEAKVRFSVNAGDGFLGYILPVGVESGRSRGPIDVVTNRKGEAIAFWWLGRHGENGLLATVESEGERLEVTFRATSVFSGYDGGSFALASVMVSGYACAVRSGSLVLSSDGRFEARSNFVCASPSWDPFDVNVIETGFYAVLDSTIVLHSASPDNAGGFLGYERDAHGVMLGDAVVFRSHGVEWRYTSFNAALP